MSSQWQGLHVLAASRQRRRRPAVWRRLWLGLERFEDRRLMTGIIPGAAPDATVVHEEEMTETLAVAQVLPSAPNAGGFTLSRDRAGVSENGMADMFTVVLTAVPNSDVVLTVTSGDASEVIVTPATLTFTSASWNLSQTVTITGVDDFVVDGDQETLVTVSVDDAASADDFDLLADQAVRVTTTDDEVAGFTLSETTATVSESGTTATFTLVLTGQPESDVILTVTSGDTSEATAGPAALTFTPGDWDSPHTVIIRGVDDSIRDGNQVTSVTVGVDHSLSDAQFGGVGSQAMSVTTIDDDVSWHNTGNAFDVDGNGTIDASDVLIIVNYLNDDSGAPALPPSPTSSSPYYDVNNDGQCTPIDILIVINYINTHGVPHTSGGEGEGASSDATAPDAAFRVTTDEPPQPMAADVPLTSTISIDSDTVQNLPSDAVIGSGIDEGRDLWQLANAARPAPLPADIFTPGPGDQRTFDGQPQPALPAFPRRVRTADAVFEVWRDNPWDELADGLVQDLDPVLR